MPTSRPVDVLTLGQARRVALAAQGLDRPRPAPGTVTTRHLQQVVDRTGLLQIDSVNVLARAHLMPLFSREGHHHIPVIDAEQKLVGIITQSDLVKSLYRAVQG